MDALETIMTRRSVRTFTDEPVTDVEIDTVLRAAMAAPSAHNGRPWRFVVIAGAGRERRVSAAQRAGAATASRRMSTARRRLEHGVPRQALLH